LAAWNRAFRKRLIETSGRDLIPEQFEPSVWRWPTKEYGYTNKEECAAWASVHADVNFWLNIKPFNETFEFLDRLSTDAQLDDEVYFITSRPGKEAKLQTERWIEANGFYDPTVLIARGNKGDIAAGLGLTHFLDDKPANCDDVVDHSPATRVFLMHRKYNESYHGMARKRGIEVVSSLEEFRAAVFA
jgi:hypothetical protein